MQLGSAVMWSLCRCYDFYGYDNILTAASGTQQLVAMNPAPSRNIVKRTGVSANHLYYVSGRELVNHLLSTDNR